MKYKIGDKVRIKSIDWYKNNRDLYGHIVFPREDEEDVEFDSLHADYCGQIMTIRAIVYGSRYIMEDDIHESEWTDEMIDGLAEEESKKEVIAWMPNGKLIAEKFNDGTITTIIDKFKYTKVSINSEFCDDKVELVISPDFELKQEGNKWFAVKKKKEYPKTYEECLNVLGYDDRETYCILHTGANERLFEALYRLKVCRDAYWKIAGEEMGLGKPWEPDFRGVTTSYVITVESGKFLKSWTTKKQVILAFPTEEMRDAFYENFKSEIESCKELL